MVNQGQGQDLILSEDLVNIKRKEGMTILIVIQVIQGIGLKVDQEDILPEEVTQEVIVEIVQEVILEIVQKVIPEITQEVILETIQEVALGQGGNIQVQTLIQEVDLEVDLEENQEVGQNIEKGHIAMNLADIQVMRILIGHIVILVVNIKSTTNTKNQNTENTLKVITSQGNLVGQNQRMKRILTKKVKVMKKQMMKVMI